MNLDLVSKGLRIRMIEEKLIEIYPSDKIQSPLHLSIGQELVAIAVCEDLRNDDVMFATYRSHAFYLAKGGNLDAFFAELFGKRTGCCGGKGGSMHLADSKVGFMGTSAIVASTISHAVGAALHIKMNNIPERLAVAVFGDGATDSGAYHEALNFASAQRLPIVFILEDNGLAVHTSKNQRQAFESIKHARSYGLQVMEIPNSQDILDSQNRMQSIYKAVRHNREPYLVHFQTYRYKEHVGISEDFSVGYRDIEEYKKILAIDPIETKRQAHPELQGQIQKEIEQAIQFAEDSPFPALEDLYSHVK